MATATERFEAIGELYYARHGRLRPGKSEAPETGRDANSNENYTLFENWLATRGFTDAIDMIVALHKDLEEVQEAAHGSDR